jgi:hypothetical protein
MTDPTTQWQPIETAPKEPGEVILGRLGPYDTEEVAPITYCLRPISAYGSRRGFWRIVFPSVIADQIYEDQIYEDGPRDRIETEWAPTEWMPLP